MNVNGVDLWQFKGDFNDKKLIFIPLGLSTFGLSNTLRRVCVNINNYVCVATSPDFWQKSQKEADFLYCGYAMGLIVVTKNIFLDV